MPAGRADIPRSRLEGRAEGREGGGLLGGGGQGRKDALQVLPTLAPVGCPNQLLQLRRTLHARHLFGMFHKRDHQPQ